MAANVNTPPSASNLAADNDDPVPSAKPETIGLNMVSLTTLIVF